MGEVVVAVAVDIADLAAGQWGLFTSAQARGHAYGASPQVLARLVDRGSLERLTHGVYRVTGAPPTPLDDLRAAWLTLDPSRIAGDRVLDEQPAVVSHRSAAVLYRLGDLDADRHEFTTVERKQSRRPDIGIHRGKLEPGEWTVVDGLPVTTVLRTCVDLAHTHTDGEHLAGVMRDAILARLAGIEELAEAMRPFAHHYGAPLGDGRMMLSRLLEQVGYPTTLGEAITAGDDITVVRSEAMDAFMRDVVERFAEQNAASIGSSLAYLDIGRNLALEHFHSAQLQEMVARMAANTEFQNVGAGAVSAVNAAIANMDLDRVLSSLYTPALRQASEALAEQLQPINEVAQAAIARAMIDSGAWAPSTSRQWISGELRPSEKHAPEETAALALNASTSSTSDS